MNTFPHGSPSSSESLSRNILARITSTFKKPRNSSDFYIDLDDPTRLYSLGDSVRGSIHLTVQKPLRITHIVLSLHGFVKVYKNPTLPGQGVPAEVRTPTPGRGKTGRQYHGNGLVSLFEDELIVCGEGRLIPGQYAFKFESQFPLSHLPSSLDFERGTISYVLVATATRPTTISPTWSCERKLKFVEPIDIAYLTIPKPRVITMTPLAKGPRPSNSATKTSRESKDTSSSVTTSRRASDSASAADINASIADVVANSVGSGASTVSAPSSSLSFQVAQCSKSIPPGEIRASILSANSKVITVSAEMLRGGCLPGDQIPIRIWIKHIRPVRSMHGVIVTLYRRARIDPHPVFPPGTSIEGVVDDVLPRSRTGLGGLSLSKSSSHSFRMDLAQTFAPLVVNPTTLEADIKTSVHAPDTLFPTIRGVPGEMITFSYHVEVVMDLIGKFAIQDRVFPRMTMTSHTPAFSLGSRPSFVGHGNQSSLETYRLMETTEILREKGIEECTFEITVGSKNSRQPLVRGPQQRWSRDGSITETEHQNGAGPDHQVPVAPVAPAGNDVHRQTGIITDFGTAQSSDNSSFIPPPQLEEPADEKTRLRLAEQRLLPSAPPQDDGPSSSSAHELPQPTAPAIEDLTPAMHSNISPTFAHLGRLITDDEHDHDNETQVDGEESAPAYSRSPVETDTMRGPSTLTADMDGHSTAPMGEDKQELERQRLLALASSPDDRAQDEDNQANLGAGVGRKQSQDSGGRAQPSAPSAPDLDEVE